MYSDADLPDNRDVHLDKLIEVVRRTIYKMCGPGPEPEEPQMPRKPGSLRPKPEHLESLQRWESEHTEWQEKCKKWQREVSQWEVQHKKWQSQREEWQRKEDEIRLKLRHVNAYKRGGPESVVCIGGDTVAAMREREFLLYDAQSIEQSARKLGWTIDGSEVRRTFGRSMHEVSVPRIWG